MKNIEKIVKIMKNGSPAMQWYQQKNSNNTTIKEAIRFLQLAEKNSKEISLNYDFQEVSRDFQGVSSNFKGFENNSSGFHGES